MIDSPNEKIKEAVERIKKRLRITKIVGTRSVKGKYGDNYTGYSAAWDSTQDDAGGAVDLSGVHTDEELHQIGAQGLTLKEGRVAALILNMQADISDHDAAVAGSNIKAEQHQADIRGIRHNYTKLITELLGGTVNGDVGVQ